MRALLGAGGLLKSYTCRVRWYSKGKTFLSPKELYEQARKAIEARARKLTHSARLRPSDAKKSETAALEILCRALASSSSAGSSSGDKSKDRLTGGSQPQQPTGSTEQSLRNKPPNIPLIDHENIKQEPQSQPKTEGSPSIAKSGAPELFNCKTCHEKTSGEDKEAANMMIVNCKNSEGDGSLLKKETSQDKSMSTGIINQSPEKPANPPVKAAASISADPQGKLSVKASVSGPQDKPREKTDTSRPQDKPPVKASTPVNKTSQEKKNATNPESDKPPEIRDDPFSMPLFSAFPLGRNPCKDGKRGAKKETKGPKKETKGPCADEDMGRGAAEDKIRDKGEKEEQIVKSVSPPVKKDDPPKAGCPSKPQMKPSTDAALDPKEQKVKKDDPPKAASQSKPQVKPSKAAIPDAKEQKATPKDSPSKAASQDEAFPLGRNPCRDGPRGGFEREVEKTKESKAKGQGPKVRKEERTEPPKEIKASSKPPASESVPAEPKKAAGNAEPNPQKEAPKTSQKEVAKEKPPSSTASSEKESEPPKKTVESCLSWKETPKESLDKKSPCAQKKSGAKNKDTKDSPKGSKPPSPPKEIKASSDPPASESVPAEPKKAAANAGPNPQKEVLEAAQKEVAKEKPPLATVSSETKSEPPKKKAPPTPTSTEESEGSPKLKQFPVAPLENSLTAYLASIEPLLTANEFKEEQKLTHEFEDNEGHELQKLLEAAADSCPNWLTPRWTQAAYLAYQAPLTVFSSPGLSFPRQKFTTPMECLTFTAKAIHATFEFKELVDQNKIPVVRMGDTDLDNSQFGKIFGTIRKPGRCFDTIEQHSQAQYVVVVYKYNFFKLPICSCSGRLLSIISLRDELEAIVNCPLERGEPFGLLTHDNRGNWAEAYTALCCPRGNADSVEAIEQSLFVVCLDDCVPVAKGQESIVQAHQLLHGGGLQQNSANRWMDKTIQLIVNPNGLAGFCYEHSPADCQPLAMLMDFVLEKVKEYEIDESNKKENTNPASLLKFRPVDDCINLWLHAAMRNIQKIANVLRMDVFQYECHGKSFIKAQGLNPDSYIQMALQLAYYNMHKTIPAQYESAHLRMFVEGRTETIRSTSNESKAFVLAMNSEKASPMEKLTALQNAVDAHEKLIKLALHGKGIDRHLFGLQQMAVENCLPLPEFFKSKGFVRSVTFQLFTSQVATTHESFMAYGPLTCDGYGCCYNPQSNKIIFALSAWQTSPKINPEQYGKAIKKALDNMRRLVLVTGGDRVGEHPCHCENIP